MKEEPRIATTSGLVRPDLVAVRDGLMHVLDAQIVTDGRCLNEMDRTKTAKYNVPEVGRALRHSFRHTGIINYSSVTLSWRGVWSASAELLLAAGLTTNTDLALVSTRVLIGGQHILRKFNSWRDNPRRGIG